MKSLLIARFLLAASPTLLAQTAGDPVTKIVRQIEARQSETLISAAEEMPAEEYSYHPAFAEEKTFASLLMHVADSNNLLCARIADEEPRQNGLRDTDSKDTLLRAVKDSFAYCEQMLAKADDSKLSDEVSLFGVERAPRTAAYIWLVRGWADHVAVAAAFLDLSGHLLPPSVRKAARDRQAQASTRRNKN